MDVDDFNQLADFVFDPSTPDSCEEDLQESPTEESRDAATTTIDAAPKRRIIRRRARKACIACHKRKVRCDVLSRGHTCTNCRLDGITCVIRQGGKRLRGELSVSVEEAPELVQSEVQRVHPVAADVLASSSSLAVESFEGDFMDASTPRQSFVPLSQHVPFTASHTGMMFSYFDFIEAETFSHIAAEDFKFLDYKGCFHLPARPVLDDLVMEYFLHVHPVLPVIDEREFWKMYYPSTNSSRRTVKNKKISLFVFRAMLFVSCSFASDDTLRRLGFQSAIEARSCFYRRAKLLYDFDTTSDPIALSQGTLILTYYSSDREPLANTSWLRLSIQYANSVNVSLYDQDSTLSDEERLIRKRLWWCIILRDRILPLGVRRSITITRDSFDFSLPRISEKDLEPEFSTSRVYDQETKRDLARIFLAQIDLAIELTDVISYVYPINGFRSFDKLDFNDMVTMLLKIQKCKENLDSWHSRFTDSVGTGPWPKKHKSVMLYSGLSSIYFQSARAALYQTESFMLQADDSATHNLRMRELGSSLHSSVASISETVRAFVQIGVTRYLPVSAVAYMALPIILNSLDLQNLSPTCVRTEGKRRQLRLLNEAMDSCHDRYSGTLAANDIIKKTIEAARSVQDCAKVDTSASTSLVQSSPEVQDWFEVFVRKPAQYLRISFTIDMSLSMGRYLNSDDLPRRLSMHSASLLPDCSVPKSLLLGTDDLPSEKGLFETISIKKPTPNSHLDYFDFDEPQNWIRSEGSPWNGQTVDKILEELLDSASMDRF